MPSITIALGSNVDPEANLRAAADLLRKEWPQIRFSPVYTTAAREVTDQPDFLNAAAVFESTLQPGDILQILQKIEEKLGKALPYRFGPRTIDLDLLLYGEETRNACRPKQERRLEKRETDTLIIPHPRMHERRFVLEPLCDVRDPEEKHPILQETWAALLQRTSSQKTARTDVQL